MARLSTSQIQAVGSFLEGLADLAVQHMVRISDGYGKFYLEVPPIVEGDSAEMVQVGLDLDSGTYYLAEVS
jgi:hypothetical protein